MALQPRNVAHPSPIHHLVLAVVRAGLGQHPARRQNRGYRFVQIDQGAPDLGMLQRDAAAQTPQHRVHRVGPITVDAPAGHCASR